MHAQPPAQSAHPLIGDGAVARQFADIFKRPQYCPDACEALGTGVESAARFAANGRAIPPHAPNDRSTTRSDRRSSRCPSRYRKSDRAPREGGELVVPALADRRNPPTRWLRLTPDSRSSGSFLRSVHSLDLRWQARSRASRASDSQASPHASIWTISVWLSGMDAATQLFTRIMSAAPSNV